MPQNTPVVDNNISPAVCKNPSLADRVGFLPWQKVFLPGQWKKPVKTGKNWSIQNCTETPQFG